MINLHEAFTNEFVRVEVNKEIGYVQITWLQHPCSEVYREQITMVAEYVLQHKLSIWLCDSREVAYTEISDQNWLLRDIFSLSSEFEQIKLAYVVSGSGFELMDTYRIQDMVKSDPELSNRINLEIFIDKQMAQSWLLENNG